MNIATSVSRKGRFISKEERIKYTCSYCFQAVPASNYYEYENLSAGKKVTVRLCGDGTDSCNKKWLKLQEAKETFNTELANQFCKPIVEFTLERILRLRDMRTFMQEIIAIVNPVEDHAVMTSIVMIAAVVGLKIDWK